MKTVRLIAAALMLSACLPGCYHHYRVIHSMVPGDSGNMGGLPGPADRQLR